jgi:hypothetical protein
MFIVRYYIGLGNVVDQLLTLSTSIYNLNCIYKSTLFCHLKIIEGVGG